MNERVDAIVIGGGVIGAGIALHLARAALAGRGSLVTGAESAAASHARGMRA